MRQQQTIDVVHCHFDVFPRQFQVIDALVQPIDYPASGITRDGDCDVVSRSCRANGGIIGSIGNVLATATTVTRWKRRRMSLMGARWREGGKVIPPGVVHSRFHLHHGDEAR